MKYIKTFESHRSSKITKTDKPINEEFFGALGRMIGNLFKKAKERINKTKGGIEIEAIYQKYLDMISKELSKAAKVDLNLTAAAKNNENPEAVATPEKPEAGAKPEAGTPAATPVVEPAKESFSTKGLNKINEADEVDVKTAVDQLKTKKGVLDQIVKKLKDMAIKEMDAILKKYGGASANPQLDIIITSKKDQFELDYLNAQINYLEKSGDKVESAAIAKKRDAIAKKIEADFKDFDTKKPVTYKEGDEVIYLLQGKKKEEYKADKKPEEQSDIVGVHKISKIEGDKFTLLDKEEKPTIVKTGAEIVGKLGGTEGTTPEYKVGDTVIFTRKGFDKKQWDAIKEEDRNPENEAVKKMITDGLINSNKIEKVEGDVLSFKNAKGTIYTKNKQTILTIVKPKE
jgi:hypothetical protein